MTTAARLNALVWVAVYLGLLLLGLGLAARHGGDSALGWTIAAIGLASVAAGVLMIWLRSRIEEVS